jgi:hypothetical protein
MKDRFEVFPDPLNNWIVWDGDEDNVAEVGTQSLQYLLEGRARVLLAAKQAPVETVYLRHDHLRRWHFHPNGWSSAIAKRWCEEQTRKLTVLCPLQEGGTYG